MNKVTSLKIEQEVKAAGIRLESERMLHSTVFGLLPAIEQYANQRVIEEVERWRNSKLQDHYPEAVDVSEFDRRIKELKQ